MNVLRCLSVRGGVDLPCAAKRLGETRPSPEQAAGSARSVTPNAEERAAPPC